MFDHVFTDAIGALKDALESALLERLTIEERLQTDVLGGDTVWESAFGLPGEGEPPRVRADLSLTWPTWSQSAYRSWALHGDPDDRPTIEVEVVFRMQRLTERPDPTQIVEVLPPDSPEIGRDRLTRGGLTVEEIFSIGLGSSSFAAEVSYEGAYALRRSTLEDPDNLDRDLSAMGGWIASTLVKLGDLELAYGAATS